MGYAAPAPAVTYAAPAPAVTYAAPAPTVAFAPIAPATAMVVGPDMNRDGIPDVLQGGATYGVPAMGVPVATMAPMTRPAPMQMTAAPMAAPRPAGGLFDMFDRNHDGSISRSEFTAGFC